MTCCLNKLSEPNDSDNLNAEVHILYTAIINNVPHEEFAELCSTIQCRDAFTTPFRPTGEILSSIITNKLMAETSPLNAAILLESVSKVTTMAAYISFFEKYCSADVGYPLHYTVLIRNKKLVKILVENGANIHRPNRQGVSAVDLAESTQFKCTEFFGNTRQKYKRNLHKRIYTKPAKRSRVARV